MLSGELNIYKKPNFDTPRLLLGFSGWMDGGEVSTGTVKYLIDKLGAQRFAEIEPKGFYINSFPGSMEITALFRPHTKIKDGLIESYEIPVLTDGQPDFPPPGGVVGVKCRAGRVPGR